jgi:hypothetical protein
MNQTVYPNQLSTALFHRFLNVVNSKNIFLSQRESTDNTMNSANLISNRMPLRAHFIRRASTFYDYISLKFSNNGTCLHVGQSIHLVV